MKMLITIGFSLLLQFAACIDYDGWLNIKIQHSLNCNGEKYCTRGNISLKSLRAGASIIEQIPFQQQHINELKELADFDGFYTIRSLVTAADTKETEFFSSVKAKAFLENGLTDVINAWVLPNGAVIAVSFQVNNSSEYQFPQSVNNEYKIKSNFYLRHVEPAVTPDTASYIQKLEREREAREKGELKDNRSFLAKYWMYIVPIAIFVMISGATNPEGPAQPAR
ncbi:ER membrane protein complex subunit 10 [Papilio machaon]|uniref:ER membrane protein complex subunit 10 n=1 Tax=Papilio machaon TaxID=76193 RepID=UPI001E6640A8|nr:ER membrane protein complex subunit 10 [Papilio machaon]